MLNKVQAHTKSKSFYTEVMKCNLVKDPYNLEKNLNKSHHNESVDKTKSNLFIKYIQKKKIKVCIRKFNKKEKEIDQTLYIKKIRK